MILPPLRSVPTWQLLVISTRTRAQRIVASDRLAQSCRCSIRVPQAIVPSLRALKPSPPIYIIGLQAVVSPDSGLRILWRVRLPLSLLNFVSCSKAGTSATPCAYAEQAKHKPTPILQTTCTPAPLFLSLSNSPLTYISSTNHLSPKSVAQVLIRLPCACRTKNGEALSKTC